jgi:hypothetical protein
MDEKRKLEKILISDIDHSASEYAAKRRQNRSAVESAAITNPPAEVKRPFNVFVRVRQQADRAEKILNALGYAISSYDGKYSLRLAPYGEKPKLVRDYDAETARVEKTLADLKRSYTLKLFAGGEEAKELFASLSSELAVIVK